VIIFEHNALYNERAVLAPDGVPVDLETAAIRRPGSDITIVASGGMVPKTLAAAEVLAGRGVDAEVIDLRSLRPLDVATMAESVARTNQALVVDEGWKTVGLSAEIAALITEECFWALDAPVRRLATIEVPIPYAQHLEAHAIAQVDDIVGAAVDLLEHGR
jgi:pyruvate/2-oxoglutarate/acetoin dehydrogenase E1 component